MKKYRDAKTGSYVTEEYALANPDTTVAEETEVTPQPENVEAKGDKKAEPAVVAEEVEEPKPVKKLEPYQERVVEEHKDVAKKLADLIKFINSKDFANVAQAEQDRLVRQRRHMEQYVQVLSERVEAF